jgi:2-octaprenyl-6-methoxyphenol hydroxylase
MAKRTENTFDVVINGGGMVGGTLACLLANAGFRIALIDRETPSTRLAPEYDGRASAIALGSQRVLKGAGLWDALEEVASPILDIRVSDQDSPLSLHYDHAALDDCPSLGYMIENRHFRVALAGTIEKRETLQVLSPDQIVSMDRPAHQVQLTLESGKSLTAKMVIGADGRVSLIRKMAKIAVTRHDYAQSGIVCTVEHEFSHEQTAYERFLASGPFAILPLQGNRSSIVWAERTDLADKIMALSDNDFQVELRQRFGDFLGALKPCGPRWCYPLSLQFTNQCIDHRLVLAGDASHAMHPLAGQGLNMGLRDVAALFEVLDDARKLGLDFGTHTVLDRYQRWRRFDNTLMLGATHGINSLFSNDVEPLRLARTFGLAAVDNVPRLKRYFMKQAMGLNGELPKLMQG